MLAGNSLYDVMWYDVMWCVCLLPLHSYLNKIATNLPTQTARNFGAYYTFSTLHHSAFLHLRIVIVKRPHPILIVFSTTAYVCACSNLKIELFVENISGRMSVFEFETLDFALKPTWTKLNVLVLMYNINKATEADQFHTKTFGYGTGVFKKQASCAHSTHNNFT